jgi:hypothetical protein
VEDADLTEIIRVWPTLSAAAREDILAIVRDALPSRVDLPAIQ